MRRDRHDRTDQLARPARAFRPLLGGLANSADAAAALEPRRTPGDVSTAILPIAGPALAIIATPPMPGSGGDPGDVAVVPGIEAGEAEWAVGE